MTVVNHVEPVHVLRLEAPQFFLASLLFREESASTGASKQSHRCHEVIVEADPAPRQFLAHIF